MILIFPYLWKGTVWDSSKQRKLLCFSILFLVAGLSYDLGSDTRGLATGSGYVDGFKRIHGLFDLTSRDFIKNQWQPGFLIIMSFFKSFTSNYLYYQIFHAFIINFIIVYFLRKHTKYLGLCLFFYCMLYYLDLNFEIQKESFAIVLGLLIYLYLETHTQFRHKLIAIGMAILGFALFHKSAIILLLYPLLKDVRLSGKGLTICFIVTLFVQEIWANFTDLGPLVDYVAGENYVGYLKYQLNEYVGGGLVYHIRIALINVIIPYAFVFFSYVNRECGYIHIYFSVN